MPSPPSLPLQVPPKGPSFDKNCTQLRGPRGAHGAYNPLTHDELHQFRRKRGYMRKDSKAALKRRLPTIEGMDRKRSRDAEDAVMLMIFTEREEVERK